MSILEPLPLITSSFIGLIGGALFIYGWRRHRTPQLVAGIVLSVFPWFVPNVVWMIIGTVVVLALTRLLTQAGW